MGPLKFTAARLAPEDLEAIEQIKARMGLVGTSDAIRFALRYWMRAEGTEPPKPKRAAKPKK